ncbi:MAG: hypothetical protein EGR23_01335 [Holdemanella biformis]|nr:hypothetical protein [Holdemanella biformis]
MNKILEKYLYRVPEAYYEYNGKQYMQSVHGKSYIRYNKAKEQAEILGDERVKNIDCIDNDDYECIVIAIENRNICNAIREWLIQKGIAEKKIIY